MNSTGLDASLIWYRMVTAWLDMLVWITSPGITNRIVLSALIVFVMCYAGILFGKFGKAEALTVKEN